MSPEDVPPRVGRGLLQRAAIACMLVVLLTAGAATAAAFLQVDDVIQEFDESREGRADIPVPEIDKSEAGKPQTLMLLGSDQRYADKVAGIKPRSDTIILVHLDPDADAITMMSLPRDLKVVIPGNSVPTKINAAYEQGGAPLTLKTVRKVLSTDERPFKINHIVQVDFGGFRKAIDYVKCVYYDVDRRYYNDKSSGENYAAIDIKPGYQKLCGQDALDYVRFRHTDNDLVRAARQQDFIRQVKNQKGVAKLKDPGNLKTLAKVFGKYFDTDSGLRDKKQLLALAKLAIFSSGKPVQQVPFEVDGEENRTTAYYLLARRSTIQKTVDKFMHGGKLPTSDADADTGADQPATGRPARKRKPFSIRDVAGLTASRREGEDQALMSKPKLRFPMYFPTYKLDGAELDGGLSSDPTTRTYTIKDEDGKAQRAYRMTYRFGPSGFSEYYGVQGTTWRDPPLLDKPDATRNIRGRELKLYYDGRKLRLVAWQSSTAAYWVSNSLLQKLSNQQMLAIAVSMTHLRGA
ncbi:MAG TPA: LCP family protein [Solirubrobacteraceae bacterium]